MNLEKRKRKKYNVLIKNGKNSLIVSHTTKQELLEVVGYLEKVCPKCHKLINVDRIKDNLYYCEGCKKSCSIDEFVNWEEWMDN